jgi:hypothetical protein
MCRGWYVCLSWCWNLNLVTNLNLAVIRARKQEYYGDSHKILIRAMDELHMLPLGRNCAKIMPIAQSSGTGKSKTVEMVGMERILLPLCLREELGENVFGASCGFRKLSFLQTHLLQHIHPPTRLFVFTFNAKHRGGSQLQAISQKFPVSSLSFNGSASSGETFS